MTQQAMSDRELLEAAAKAAEIALVDRPFLHNGRAGYALTEDGYWNPLLSDSDAFRLAVALNIDLYMPCKQRYVRAVGRADICIDQEVGFDSLAATRRAIVRAAAAISRTGEA